MLRETHTKWLILALAIVCVPLPIGYSVVGGFASLVFGTIFYVQGFQHEGVGPVLEGLVWTSASAWLLYLLSKKITAAIHSTRPLDQPLWLLATFIGFVILTSKVRNTLSFYITCSLFLDLFGFFNINLIFKNRNMLY